MLILIALAIFLGALVLFGWYFVRVVLGENKLSVLLGLGPLTGFVFYIFLLNATSYFIPITINFYLVWAAFLVCTIILSVINYKRQKAIEADVPVFWLKILCATALFMSLWAGFVASRGLFYDTLNFGHLPLAITISEGNFPIKNIIAPIEALKYHYAPELLSAAMYRITGLPIERTYDIQIFFSVIFIFFLIFAIVYYLLKNIFIGYLAAVLTLYGGGLNYLYIIEGIKNIYKRFILGLPVENLFGFLPRIINGEIVDPVIGTINHHWTALGFAALLALIYVYIRLFDLVKKDWPKFILFAVVIVSFLALTAETMLGILGLAFAAYAFILFIEDRRLSHAVKVAIIVPILLFAIAGPIIFFQGGILSRVPAGESPEGGQLGSFIPFGKDLNIIAISSSFIWSENMPVVRVLSSDFLKNFGLPLILFVPAIIFLRKKVGHIAFFSFLAAIPISIPIFIFYDFPHELLRFFFPGMLFLSFITALFLGSLLLIFKDRKNIRIVVLVSIFMIILPGIIFEAAYSIVPLKKIENIPHEFYYVKDFFSKPQRYIHELFSRIPAPLEIDKSAFRWIKNNTGIGDIFFYPIENPDYLDLTMPFEKLKFIVFSGRMSPDYKYGETTTVFPPRGAHEFNQVIHNCSLDLLKDLGFNYMYVSPKWPAGLEQKCLATGKLLKVFETSDGTDFRRIYKINY